MSSDTEYYLQDRVMAIANWSIKSLGEDHAALREASLRIAAATHVGDPLLVADSAGSIVKDRGTRGGSAL